MGENSFVDNIKKGLPVPPSNPDKVLKRARAFDQAPGRQKLASEPVPTRPSSKETITPELRQEIEKAAKEMRIHLTITGSSDQLNDLDQVTIGDTLDPKTVLKTLMEYTLPSVETFQGLFDREPDKIPYKLGADYRTNPDDPNSPLLPHLIGRATALTLHDIYQGIPSDSKSKTAALQSARDQFLIIEEDEQSPYLHLSALEITVPSASDRTQRQHFTFNLPKPK